MIDLVLNDARENLIGVHLDFLQVAVEKFDANLLGPNDLLANSGQAKATFFEDGLSFCPNEYRINENERIAIFHALDIFEIDDGERQRLPNLIRRQPDAIGIAHRGDHVINQLLEFTGILLDLRGLLPQNGMIEGVDGENRHG